MRTSLPLRRLLVPLVLVAGFVSCHQFPTNPDETRWPSPPAAPPLSNLTGRVLDQITSQPVGGARVWVDTVSWTTDAYGNYNIAAIRGPIVLVTVAKPGYDTLRQGLQLLSTNMTFDLKIAPTPVQLR